MEASIGGRQQTPMLASYLVPPEGTTLKKAQHKTGLMLVGLSLPHSHGPKKGGAFMCGAEHLIRYLWVPGMGCGVYRGAFLG